MPPCCAPGHFRIYRICKILFEKIKIFAILIQLREGWRKEQQGVARKLKLKCLAGHTRERVASQTKSLGKQRNLKVFPLSLSLSLALYVYRAEDGSAFCVHVCSVIVFPRNFHKQLCLCENSAKEIRLPGNDALLRFAFNRVFYAHLMSFMWANQKETSTCKYVQI